MKAIRKATALTGKYTDKQTGKEKKLYTRVGTLFERDDKTLCMRLEALPLSKDWTGWVNFYPLDGDQIKKDNGLDQQGQQAPQGNEIGQDDIPF